MTAFVSVCILTHNAPTFVENSVRSLAERTRGVRYEVVVVDNASEECTRALVQNLCAEGIIDRLRLLDYNSFFSEGNNLAAEMASPKATHLLLLNSDIEVKAADWLAHLLEIHELGITSYGYVDRPIGRVDGYCLLIDADLYRLHWLDENHQWWWAVTKLQAKLLREGYSVKGYQEHARYLHHFGGRSGDSFKAARGMDVTEEQLHSWFGGRRPLKLDVHTNEPQLDRCWHRAYGRLSRWLNFGPLRP